MALTTPRLIVSGACHRLALREGQKENGKMNKKGEKKYE
jgi:hypothetical protein